MASNTKKESAHTIAMAAAKPLPTDMKLKVSLKLEDSGGNVVAEINQDASLPGLCLPSFLPGAYSQVEKTLNVIGIDYFKALVKQYFYEKLQSVYGTSGSGITTVHDVFSDKKRVIALEDTQPDNSPLDPVTGAPDQAVIDLPLDQA